MTDLNMIISKTQSFETSIQNNAIVFIAEGEMVKTLRELGFSQHQYLNHQTGRQETSNMWYKANDKETEGLFIFLGCHNRWTATKLTKGEYKVI